MALWGNTDADEAKPKWMTSAEKADVFATSRGWVKLNGKGLEEVICSIGGLATALAGADINKAAFKTSSFGEGAGGNIDITLTFNEKVTVAGGPPTITVTNSQAGSGTDATFTAAYQSGSGTNKLTFRKTYAAGNGGVAEDDVLSVASQNIALAGGTVKDTGTTVNSGVAVPAGSGTLTAVA
jgi:hypothetical protein